jgi:hypothetical protein
MTETKPGLNNGATTMQYRYDHLPERAIRLLEIPEKLIEQPWLLNDYDLEHCSPYVCLSYTWGPPLNTEECKAEYEGAKRSLFLQSEEHTGWLEVGLNLWEGLEQLIAAGRTGYLWVDALCINQDDPQERSSQVAIMGQIYRDSEEVIVWLGKDQSNLEDFSWFHDTLLPAFEKHFDEGGGICDLTKTVETANLGVCPLPRWRGYILFYEQHRWFHRCWVLQEVALARKIEVFCGSTSLDFQDIADLSRLLNSLGSNVVPPNWRPEGMHTDIIAGHKAHKAAAMRDACQVTALKGENGPRLVTGAETPLQLYLSFCLFALSAASGHQATDPRDKVYACLGIAAKFLPPDEEVILVPDYCSSTVEVYRKTTSYLIQNLPYLAVLSFVNDRSLRILSALPSWVPDFSTDSVFTTYVSRYEVYPHNACPSGKSTYPRSIVGSTLSLYGGYFDTVTTVVETMVNYRIDSGKLSGKCAIIYRLEIFSQLLGFLADMKRQYSNGQGRLEALSRTLLLNQIDREHPPLDVGQLFRAWLLSDLAIGECFSWHRDAARLPLERCMKILQDLEEVQDMTLPSQENIRLSAQLKYTSNITILERAPSGFSPEDMPPPDEEDVMDSVKDKDKLYDRGLDKGLFSGQRLYMTSRGLIGLGPPSMRSGDHVCFICDSTVPFILRPEVDARHYCLIGETYVHGFMNGEVLETDFKDQIGQLFLV